MVAASEERWFLMEFWNWGVMMAYGKTANLSAAAEAIGRWQAGALLRELRSVCRGGAGNSRYFRDCPKTPACGPRVFLP